MISSNSTRSGAMGAWGVVWHQMRWDLVRMRWWIGGAIALMVIQLYLAQVSEPDAATATLGFLVVLFLMLLGVVWVQSDSPIRSSAFFRGRPMAWWVMPAAKVAMLTAAVSIPTMLLSVIPFSQFQETWSQRFVHVWQILAVVGFVVLQAFIFGAITSGFAEIGVLLVLNYLASLVATQVLQAVRWPGVAWLQWVAVAATVMLAIDVYRRVWKPRSAMIAMISISLLGALATSKQRVRDYPGRTGRPADSVRVVIDSVTTERAHVARVAFTVETTADIDGLRFEGGFTRVGSRSTLFSLERLGRPADMVVEGTASENGTLTVADPDRSHYTQITKRGGGGGRGYGNLDLHFERTPRGAIRRAHAVAIVAIWDSSIGPGLEISMGGVATAFTSRVESRLPLRDAASSMNGAAHWAIRRILDDGRRVWELERTALGPRVADADSNPYPTISSRFSTRFVARGSAMSTGVAVTGSGSSYGVMVVPGLIRTSESIRIAGVPRESPSLDTLELLQVNAKGSYGLSAKLVVDSLRGANK